MLEAKATSRLFVIRQALARARGSQVEGSGAAVRGAPMRVFLDRVRGKYSSRTEWFDLDLPWDKRDAMEITVIERKGPE